MFIMNKEVLQLLCGKQIILNFPKSVYLKNYFLSIGFSHA